ncbi:hypothetical protein GA0061078_1629 [Bifidobacterium bohemicum]|uniref:Uncharacterized protein n=1 Tax=Bifidobacterium bohemicum DSM 22767 TaxID=1437606 RepID=A0A086ZHC2_9BIFI|nr:hypothetical protein BBOH_0729 [Bifidobacterium bohemicum DSM 22767]SCC14989.1 hypothetical protein GA0061078_1629 [Bifidobacterium bohemicum]
MLEVGFKFRKVLKNHCDSCFYERFHAFYRRLKFLILGKCLKTSILHWLIGLGKLIICVYSVQSSEF